MCDQQRLRPACAYAQSDQSLCQPLEYSMTVKLQTEQHLEFLSLKGGCTGSSESTHVNMPHCWKSHVAAHYHDITFFALKKRNTCTVKKPIYSRIQFGQGKEINKEIKHEERFNNLDYVYIIYRIINNKNKSVAMATKGQKLIQLGKG